MPKEKLKPQDNIVRVSGDRMDTTCPTCKKTVRPTRTGKDPILYARAIEQQFEYGHKQVLVQSRGGANNKALTAVSIALRLVPYIHIISTRVGTDTVKRENYDSFKKITTLTIVLSDKRGEKP